MRSTYLELFDIFPFINFLFATTFSRICVSRIVVGVKSRDVYHLFYLNTKSFSPHMFYSMEVIILNMSRTMNMSFLPLNV